MATGEQAPVTQIAQAARRLQQEAQGHMTLASQHRKRARTLYRELEQLAAACAEYGIVLEITINPPASPNSQGGTSGDEDQNTG